MSLKRLVKFVLPLVILSTGIGVFAALKSTKPEQPKAEIKERIWRVEVEPVAPRTLSPVLTLYGRVESPSVFKASAPAVSRVTRLPVREGERVEQGQLLLTLDERDFLPRMEQSKAEVAELEAQIRSEEIRYQADLSALEQEKKLLELARASVRRAERLLSQKLGSDSAVDEAEQAVARQALAVNARRQAISDHPARLKALEARLVSARSRLREREVDYERSQVRAPYAGLLAEVNVAEGDQVRDNTVLLSLYDPGGLEVRARIPAPFQQEVQRAVLAGTSLEGETDGQGESVQLRLVRLAGEASSSGVDGIFAIEQGAEALRIGQVLRFRLRRPPREDVFPVPYQAVYGGDRIYTLDQGAMRGHVIEPVGGYLDDDGRERLLVRAPRLQVGAGLVVTHMPNAIEGLKAEAVRNP